MLSDFFSIILFLIYELTFSFMFYRDATGVVLHKDSKWYQQWKEFKDNNAVFNSKNFLTAITWLYLQKASIVMFQLHLSLGLIFVTTWVGNIRSSLIVIVMEKKYFF